MIIVNIHEAKARFSELIRAAENGETVQVCRRNAPVISFTPTPKKPKKKRVLGLHDGEFEVPDSVWEPMSEEELALWDAPLFPNETLPEKP